MDRDRATHLIYTTDGVYVDGIEGEDNAKSSVERRNAEAERLGITARYEFFAKEDAPK